MMVSELGLVDLVLWNIIYDANVRKSAILTFNVSDFQCVCDKNNVEILT